MDLVWRGLGIGAAVGAVVGAIVIGIWNAVSETSPDWTLVGGLAVLIGAVIGGAFALRSLDRRPYRLNEWAPLRAETVLRHAVRWYRNAGWLVQESTENQVVFVRKGKPNSGTTIMLLLLLLLPGLLYWLLASRRFTTTVSALDVPDGCDIEIVVNESGDGAMMTAIAFFNSLHDLVAEPNSEDAAA
jgi:MFS family permease